MHKPYAGAIIRNTMHVKILECNYFATQLKPFLWYVYISAVGHNSLEGVGCTVGVYASFEVGCKYKGWEEKLGTLPVRHTTPSINPIHPIGNRLKKQKPCTKV